MPTIGEALAAAQRTIDGLDARVLLSHAIGVPAAYLIAHAGERLAQPQALAYDALVERRARGEPVAYITGRREFYGMAFRISPAVLIPRPETELLVECAIAHVPLTAPCEVLDLGTGSGCVAISIASQRPQARVTAVDASEAALALAQENARTLGVTNVSFPIGNWFAAVPGRVFQIVVANPPYIREADPHLGEGDLRHEPTVALVGGADGLDAIRAIVTAAPHHLVPGGFLFFEHGYDQAATCRALLAGAGFGAVGSWRDLAGHERVAGGRKLDGVARQPLHSKVE